MTSTSVTTVGGVVIITQVIPKDENSIPLENPAKATPQTPPPTTEAPPSPTKKDEMTTTLLRGEPLGLGIVQIFIGLLCVLFSLTVVFSWALMVYAPFCLATAFVFSGALAVAAARRTSVTQVWASLVSNVVSVVLGVAGVAYLCWLLATGPPSYLICDAQTFREFTSDVEMRMRCADKLWLLDTTLYGVLGLLLVLLVLQVCVAITVCVFSSRAIRHRSLYSPLTMEAGDHSTVASPEHCSDVNLMDSDSEDHLCPPSP